MRLATRSVPKAVSTALGLTAPALAALLLTSNVTSAAAPAPASSTEPVVAVAPAATPTSTPTPAATPRVTVAPRPVVTSTPRRTVVRPSARPVTRRTTAPQVTTTRTASQTAQPRGVDDYPYRTQTDFYAIDRWGFTQRQCVSFAAWRLAQHGHAIDNRDKWGSAYTWDDTARRLGIGISAKPRVGAVAQWNAHESGAYYGKGSAKPNGRFTAGGYGHVGWVKQVYADGSVLVEQYNLGGDRSYSVMRVKAPRYLLIA